MSNLLAEWNFFATSHGKSACNGVVGTVKQLAARASFPEALPRTCTPSAFHMGGKPLKGARGKRATLKVCADNSSERYAQPSPLCAIIINNCPCWVPVSLRHPDGP